VSAWSFRGQDRHVDERESHFFTLAAEVCQSARLAELPVRIRLEDGSEYERRDVTVTPIETP